MMRNNVKAALAMVLETVDRIAADRTVSGADYRELVEEIEGAMSGRREGLDADDRAAARKR